MKNPNQKKGVAKISNNSLAENLESIFTMLFFMFLLNLHLPRGFKTVFTYYNYIIIYALSVTFKKKSIL